MFKGDDDDDEEATMGAVRYSVMPSLVALQQMRNRLHLAYLGRKLMKWTALATGKELRRISLSIAQSLENYAEQMSTAYMLLARARFYVPKLNDVVLENIAVNASSNCGVSMRSISGVKITKFTLQETGYAPYPLLGIEKGGMAIYDAKRSWLNLLKLMIKILQQRTTFKAVEQAHRSATQRMKMLAKVVIPRTLATIEYIICELEDRSREDLFRMRRILGVRGNFEDHLKEIKKAKKYISKEQLQKKDSEEIGSESFISYTELPFMGDCENVIINNSVLKERKQLVILEDDDVKIGHFKGQINEILDVTKEIEEKGIAITSVDRYIEMEEKIRAKFELKMEKPEITLAEPLCDYSEQIFETENLEQKPILPRADMGILEIPELKMVKRESENETNVKQTTDVSRVQNVGDKIVIQMKKEIRTKPPPPPPPPPPPINSIYSAGRLMCQSSNVSFSSNLYSKKTMMLTMKDSNNICIRDTTSEAVSQLSFMVGPVVRSYISSANTFTIDTDLTDTCIEYISRNVKNISTNNLNFIDFEPYVVDYVPFSSTCNTINYNLHRSNILIDSDLQLISNIICENIRKLISHSPIDGNYGTKRQKIIENEVMDNEYFHHEFPNVYICRKIPNFN